MAKGEAKRINKMNMDLTRQAGDKYGKYYGGLESRLPQAQEHADKTWNASFGGLSDFLAGQGRRGGSGSIGNWEGRFAGLADNPLEGVDVNRARGLGVFDEFARTGGLSEEDKGSLRARSANTVGSFYGALKDELDRAARGSGYGGGPGFDAQMAKIARQQSQGTSQALLDAEESIIDRVLAGRQWGASGASSSELGLGDLRSRNKIAGLEGGLRAAGMGADFGANYDRDTLGALGMMMGLRENMPNEEFGYLDRMGGAIEGELGTRRGLLQDRMQYNPNRGFWDYAAPLIAGGVSALGTAYGVPSGGVAAGGQPDSFGGGVTRYSGTGNRVQWPTAGIHPRRTMSDYGGY